MEFSVSVIWWPFFCHKPAYRQGRDTKAQTCFQQDAQKVKI
jgi:hypothetical protein